MESLRYESTTAREREAFQKLIAAKATLVVSIPDAAEDLERERLADKAITAGDSRVYSTQPLTYKVVVDVRDFRSSLPSLLYAGGFQVIPRTLAVADFVLSSEICVERKGIQDLFQSLASGRLYNQAEGMSLYYKNPSLLIEFTLDRPFTLHGAYEISPDSIQTNSIITRICQLVLAFPNLRILWSRSPHATVSLFKSIMTRHDEVDVNKAVLAGTDGNVNFNDYSDSNKDEFEEASARLNARALLLTLPGINIQNYRAVMASVENIMELSRMEARQLAPIIGPVNAAKLCTFFRQRA